ncbi:MAG: Ldh family oxidoreductase [Reyranellaceae bacterium]
MTDPSGVVVTPAELTDLVGKVLGKAGLLEDNIGPVAGTIVAAERDGAHGHGILRLPGYVQSLQTKWVDGAARPQITRATPGQLRVDARNGFAQVALAAARAELLEMAERNGVAVLLIRDSHHYAALWPDIEGFAEAGFVAFTCVNSKRRMAVWGGHAPVVGTNAFAFAAPRSNHRPMVWDQSASVMSVGELLIAAAAGREVGPGVGCDSQGNPTGKPSEILNGGALFPIGGAKGASIAVMVEILAAALTGGRFGFEDQSPKGVSLTSLAGQFLLLVNAKSANERFGDRVNDLLAAISESGAGRYPGDRRYKTRQRSMASGIPISSENFLKLTSMAK